MTDETKTPAEPSHTYAEGEHHPLAKSRVPRRSDLELYQFLEGSSEKSTENIRHWNDEFQQILQLPDSKDKYLKLRNLGNALLKYSKFISKERDFVYVAETYGKIIIAGNTGKCHFGNTTERNLPTVVKTIKPVHVGGVAGGEKYRVAGILFKFAVDSHNLYGSGIYKEMNVTFSYMLDEYAMKAAAHDLRGLQGYFNLRLPEIHVPLVNQHAQYFDTKFYRWHSLIIVAGGYKQYHGYR
jgi:hypothetical protein